MTPDEAQAALREALEKDDDLAARFAAATTHAEVHAVAAEAGVPISATAAADSHELTEEDLEAVSGGYTFPKTDWIYCDNPWTNVWCTLKC
ncbi:MAG: Nif11-like leader peptide family natural product [Actinomycetota bacterium]|nr:Nif11-like leader peptide family natural product [Actinomycetota bacterium]